MLAIADLLYRRSSLEHAAASLENVLQALVLIALMCLPVIAFAPPPADRLGAPHQPGYLIGQGGLGVVAATGLPGGLVGFIPTTIITSLPELVTLIAAVRIGALSLGIGTIIGGNTFDALMIFLADITYLPGPVCSAASSSGRRLTGATTLVTVALTAGLIMRDLRGIGFEG